MADIEDEGVVAHPKDGGGWLGKRRREGEVERLEHAMETNKR